MRENIIYSIAGIVLGFFIGFFLANATWQSQPQASVSAGNSARAGGVARPLNETEMNGQLPPDHPNVAGERGAGAPAATSAQAQAAMDEADRNPKDFAAQMKAAATFYQLESYDKATLYLTRALSLKPTDADALTGMAQTKYRTGDYTGAASYFEKILAQNPRDADTRASLGDSYFQRQPPDYDRAIAEYRKALEVDPKHEHALAALADTMLRKGDQQAARELIDRLASANPTHPALPTLRSMLNTK